MSSDQRVPLRDFLSGLMYPRAEAVFQRALDPVVKRVMREHFGEGNEHRAMLARQQQKKIERAEKADRIHACLEGHSMDLQAPGDLIELQQQPVKRGLTTLPTYILKPASCMHSYVAYWHK